MNPTDQENFRKNYIWFNQFFGDLKQLMEKISGSLISNFALSKKNVNFYYPKLLLQPTIPPYYLTALENKAFVVQVFAVLDISLFPEQGSFKREPSLVIVKHARTGKGLWPEDYGVRIITNNRITQSQSNDKVVSGKILASQGEGTQYSAFQVSLDPFMTGKDINAAIQTEIIDVLRDLPAWTDS